MKNNSSKAPRGGSGAAEMAAMKKVAMGTSKAASPEAGAKIQSDWCNHCSIEQNPKDGK